MDIYLANVTEVHLAHLGDEALTVTKKNEALNYSAIAMWITALGRCTYAVLDHYALRLDLDPDGIEEILTWDFSDEPTTIKNIELTITWPELPENRRKAVERAAHKCTIHNTIKTCVEITVHVVTTNNQ
jgi:uncharacterized OsmC-like protein